MSNIERQVKKAQHRLWINRWLRLWGWCLLFGAGAWTAAWMIDRLLLPGVMPLGLTALIGLAASLLVSAVWLILARDSDSAAAAALDQAAGLRERVATGLHVHQDAADPFARAVFADAEHAVAGLSARRFVPIRWTRSLSLGSAMIGVAALSLLLPAFDLLNSKEARASENDRLSKLNQVRSQIAKPRSVMRQIAEQHPDLDLNKDEKKFDDPLTADRRTDPDVLRRETVKKLDRLQDALQQKADSERFQALNEVKKRLKQLGEPSDPKTELGMLMGALSSGDFQEAQKALKDLQENLARRTRDGKIDPQTAQKLRKQLNEMAKKLEKAAQDKQSSRELQNAGLSPAEAKRVLEALSKKDPKQLEKMAKQLAQRLKDQGMSEEQIKKMLEKIKQRKKASKQCRSLGKKMASAASKLEQGNTQAAQSELGKAGEMLNEMEQLEQAMNELDAQMAQMDDLRDDLNEGESPNRGKCKQCSGSGFRADGSPCPWCNGTGR